MSMCLSLAVALGLSGCGEAGKSGGYTQYDKSKKGEEKKHDHAHPEHGPHGGHLVEFGEEEYHGEVCFDGETKKITVYVLDGEAKKAVPIAEKEVTINLVIDGKPQPFTAKAAPQDGEPEGKSSRFELSGSIEVAEHIKDEEDIQGNVSATIDGKPYSGKIVHDHDHAGHDHAAHGKEKKDDHKDEHKDEKKEDGKKE
jgi:hypothetical protein